MARGRQLAARRAGISGATARARTSTLASALAAVSAAGSATTPGIVRSTSVTSGTPSSSSTWPSGFAIPRSRYAPGASPVMSTYWNSRWDV